MRRGVVSVELEEVWRLREEVYSRLSGTPGTGILTLPHERFRERFGEAEVDLRWLFLGVVEFPPPATPPPGCTCPPPT